MRLVLNLGFARVFLHHHDWSSLWCLVCISELSRSSSGLPSIPYRRRGPHLALPSLTRAVEATSQAAPKKTWMVEWVVECMVRLEGSFSLLYGLPGKLRIPGTHPRGSSSTSRSSAVANETWVSLSARALISLFIVPSAAVLACEISMFSTPPPQHGLELCTSPHSPRRWRATLDQCAPGRRKSSY